MEAVALLFAAWWFGRFLNERFPNVAWNWNLCTFAAAILIVLHSWYVIFKKLFELNSDTES